MYKDNKTTAHQRNTQGNVVQQKQKKERSTASQFVSVAVTTLAIALVFTGLLLHTSMRTNANSKAKIENLERQAIVRQEAPKAPTIEQLQEKSSDGVVSDETGNADARSADGVVPAPQEHESDCIDCSSDTEREQLPLD